jgi:N-acetylmuramoyl-L-alanine amidase
MTIEDAMQTISRLAAWLVVGAVVAGPGAPAVAGSARTLYTKVLNRERDLRDTESRPTLRELRNAVIAYENVVRRYPTSGYSDNALWQAANLALLAYERFQDQADLRRGLRLLARLKQEYPFSSLKTRADELARKFEPTDPPPSTPAAVPVARPAAVVTAPAAATDAPSEGVTIRDIRRAALADGVVRVTIEMDGEALFRQERLENPRRLFFDVKGARATGSLQDATLKFTDGVVRVIRTGRRPNNTTRVVMDMDGVESHNIFTLYNPYRLIVDFKKAGGPAAATVATTGVAAPPLVPIVREKLELEPPVTPDVAPAVKPQVPLAPVPMVPSANLNGQFSLARQLGLGISRIVIDAGHGGHDPGARANGINEAELVLDVAGRLRTLLEKQPAIEVTMTRGTDVFVPLEQRTAIANRQGADLFLSIHANASRNSRARGVETYFLNFASNPEAEAVAARENSTSGGRMHSLPDIVRAIALNNKIDESRDFADVVQKSMVSKLNTRNGQVKDLGVKQAPFVVLIGAGMPSVLAEISFLTNKQDAQLLKTGAYRQQIAEALYDAILKYQGGLKKMRTVAAK